MLSRFCCSSHKIVRFSQIAHISRTHSQLYLLFTQKSKFATTAALDPHITKVESLETVIKELRNRVEKKSRLTNNDFQSLLTKLKTQKVDNVQALEILKCCSFARTDQNLNKIVNDIWNELKKHDNQYKIQHYNCMLQFARDNADQNHAQRIFDEMAAAGIKPDAFSYQLLLGAHCRAGNLDKAIEVLSMMDENNFYLNEGSFNNLVQCQIMCGNLDAAKETITTLTEAGFKVNYYTLEALLIHHGKAGDLENIQKTLEHFKQEKIEVLNRDILKVICEMAANGHPEKIDSLLPLLKPATELRRSFVNVITLFVEHKQSPIVPKILQSIDGDVNAQVNHLIQEMVRLSTPETEFNETIVKIEAMGITFETHFDLFKPALESSSSDFIRKLLYHMKSKSIEASESTFEKLFQLAAKKGSKEVLDCVSLMCSDFKIQPQITFVRDVILPGLNVNEKPALTFVKLQGTNVRLRNVAIAIINNSLNNGDIKTAYDFASTNSSQSFYGIDLIKRPLLKALTTNGDISLCVSFVRLIHDSFRNVNNYYKNEEFDRFRMEEQQRAFINDTLFMTLSNQRGDTQRVIQILIAFIEEGLTINANQAEKIQNNLGVDSETQIGRLLKRLSSEDLKPKPRDTKKSTMKAMNKISSDEVQNILDEKQSRIQNSASTEKLLFYAYIREGNVSKIESMISENKFKLTDSDYASLVDFYIRRNFGKALNLLSEVQSKNPSFKLDSAKVSRIVSQMIDKEMKFDEVEQLLKYHRPDKCTTSRFDPFEKLLYRLALNGNTNLVEKLSQTRVIENNYVGPTAESTGPVILSYLKNNLNAEAVEKYDYFAQTYKLVPLTMVLFIELIKRNEIDLLQRAFDICEKANGETTSLCRLAFAFIACDRERQAIAILESDRTRNISYYISRECIQYVRHNRIEPAKALLRATKGLYHDRQVIFKSILEIYIKQNKAQEALDLWYDYSTEAGIIPRSQFKSNLIKLLTKNNIEIPDELKSFSDVKRNQ